MMRINGPRKRRRSSAMFGRRTRRRRMSVVPRQRGFMRVGGYYGRYAGAYGMGKYGQRPEHKFLDTVGISTPTPAGLVNPGSLNLIPQGVTESERVGRKCTIRQVTVRACLNLQPTTDQTDTSDTSRIIVFLDKQANGAVAVPSDILEQAALASYFNLENSSRFVILVNKFFPINTTAAGTGVGGNSTADNTIFWQWGKRCNIPVEFSGVTGAIGEVRSNNIGILTVNAFTNVIITTRSRVRFSDN